MRPTTLRISLAALATITVAGAIAACTDARAAEQVDRDAVARDLALASAVTMSLAGRGVDSANLATLETKPLATPEASPVVKRAAGTRVRRPQSPTVGAAPIPGASELADADALAGGATADVSEPVAVLPLPAAIPAGPPAGDYGSGGGMFGTGGGRIGGGGVVIRGGGVHGDNCELHRRPRGTTTRGPVYVPVVPTSPPATANRPARPGTRVGPRGAGTVNRRPTGGTGTVGPAPAEPARMDPRPSRRGL